MVRVFKKSRLAPWGLICGEAKNFWGFKPAVLRACGGLLRLGLVPWNLLKIWFWVLGLGVGFGLGSGGWVVLGVGGWFWVLGLVLGLLFRCSVSGAFLGRWVRCFFGSFLGRVSGAVWGAVFAPLQGSVSGVLRSVKFCCRALFLMALPCCGVLSQGSAAGVLRYGKFCRRALFRAVSVLPRGAAGACFLARFLGELGCSFFA